VTVRRCAWVVAIALSAFAPSARAQSTASPPAEPEATSSVRAADWREQVARLELGYRGVFVTNAGYNPFSTHDYFSGVSLVASRTVFATGRFSFAPGIAWDYGSSGATSRGDATQLQVQRITIPLEGRVHFGRWGYAFGRLAPGAAVERAEVDDASAPSALTKSLWLFTGDASVGYALPVPPLPEHPGRAIRAWLQADAGYTWVADNGLNLEATTSQLTDQVDLASLGMRGAFIRVAVAASY
jgi:hypothetical protein